MEYAFSELLSRQDLLRILQEQRQLNIPDIEHLSNDELKRIYKSFAVPLAKREPRCGRIKQSSQKRALGTEAMEVEEPMQMNIAPQIAYFDILINDCGKEKRQFDYEDRLDDDSLSSATKRIKIAWS